MNQKSLPTGHLCQGGGGSATGTGGQHPSAQSRAQGHSLAEGLAVPRVGADAVVLAVVAVAEGGAGGVPVRPGHAGEAGPAGEEHSAGVQRPLCSRRGFGCATPSPPSREPGPGTCPPCDQPRPGTGPWGPREGAVMARPHARPTLTQSHVAQDGSRAHRQPWTVAAGAQGAVEELAQPRRLHPLRREQRVVLQHHAALPEGTPHDESRGGSSDLPVQHLHPGTAAAPQRVTLPAPLVPGSIARCGAAQAPT